MPVQIETKFQRPKDSSPIVGIDLGTTNSLVAIVRDGKPEVLHSREGERLIPSVVSFPPGEDAPVVGYRARKEKIREARNTVFSVKRLLGRGFNDLQSTAHSLPYELVGGQEQGDLKVRVGEKTYSAIEISAMILREIKKAAEESLKTDVNRAVITVPAYFNDSQRQATRAAGRLAGLDVLRIVNEPTAAALSYGLDKKKEGLIAVYDLGGGTFDVSILKLHNGIFEVLATNGDTTLGGDDLDRVLVQLCAEELQKEQGIDIWKDVQLKAALIEAAENVKMKLSTESKALLSIELPDGGRYERPFTREEFESHVRPLLEKTRGPCLSALKDAGLALEDLTDVVMVGGSTRLPIVQKIAGDIFRKTPNTSVHPDEVVATGAAIQADILAGNNRDLLLLDVTPLSLGIETYGGIVSILIPRNTRIPTVAKETFTTFVNNQTGVDVHVLQGEREKVEDNRSLARFKLGGIEPAPAGIPRVEVTFLIDADGILQVSAKDLHAGTEQTIEVKPSFGLTDEEIENMLRASMEHAEEDVAYRRFVEARNEAEPILRNTEAKMQDARRLLSSAELQDIEARIAALKAAIEARDPGQIKEKGQDLNTSTVKLAELLLKETLKKAQETTRV